eukprot:176763-Pleurochrysis_carterae.AAC.2
MAQRHNKEVIAPSVLVVVEQHREQPLLDAWMSAHFVAEDEEASIIHRHLSVLWHVRPILQQLRAHIEQHSLKRHFHSRHITRICRHDGCVVNSKKEAS